MKNVKMSVSELSEKYGISNRTIRERINQWGFNLTWTRRRNGVREYPVTDDFVSKVLTIHPRFKNLRKKEEEKKPKELRLPVKDVLIKTEPSSLVDKDVAVTFVFNGTDIRKLVDFIRSFGSR